MEYIQTEGGRLLIGSPDAFSRRMKMISDSSTGMGGCIDIDSVVNTPFGPFWFDRKRKRFVTVASNRVQDVTGKMQSWLEDNLTGPVHGVYDNFTGNLYYTCFGERGCEWTLSFNPVLLQSEARNGWNSFHSFKPLSYLQVSNNYLSDNGQGLWRHNKKGDYQRYYGAVFPFDVGVTLKNSLKTIVLQGLEVYVEFSHMDGSCKRYDPTAFFDEVLVHNHLRSTGIREVYVHNYAIDKHILAEDQHRLTAVSPLGDFTYRLNNFPVESTDQPLVCYTCDGYEITKAINVKQPHEEQMKGKWFRVHFIKKIPDYKILMQLTVSKNEEVSQ